MKKLRYSNGIKLLIIEDKDDIENVKIQFRGERADLVCIPINYAGDLTKFVFATLCIREGNYFYGGIMLYTDLAQLRALLKPIYDIELFPQNKRKEYYDRIERI